MADWTVEESQAGARADQFLAAAMQASRGEAHRLLEQGDARVNGAIVKPNRKLRVGEIVSAVRPAPVETKLEAETLPLDVVFEDEDLLVINKARGMVVHPAPGSQHGTLVNAVLGYVTSGADDLSGIGGELRPGIVHRLDKDTSGLMMVAKSDMAHISLQAQIQAKTAERRYEAILWGVPKFERANIDAPIGRHPGDRKKMAVLTDPRQTSRDAVTELTVRETLVVFCAVEAKLQTGRTHQIRVHCAYAGHPVVGDPLYGGQRKVPSQGLIPRDRIRVEKAIEALNGQALHAFSLSFDHPRTGERLAFAAPAPEVMQNLLETLRVIYGKDRSEEVNK
jgi:23S rRNA pseudouridine1911/1915/1917 synthase